MGSSTRCQCRTVQAPPPATDQQPGNECQIQNIVAPTHIQSGTYLYVLYFRFLLMLLLQVLIYGSQLFNILQMHKLALVLTSTGESRKLKAIHTAAKLTGAVWWISSYRRFNRRVIF